MGEFLKSINENLESHWLKASVLPILLFFFGLAVIYFDLVDDWHNVLSQWNALSTDIHLIGVGAFVTLVLVTAVFFDAIELFILRWAQGYWRDWWCLGIIYEFMNENQRKVLKKWNSRFNELKGRSYNGKATKRELLELRHLETALRYMPNDADHVMPTTIGNILRAAEEHVRGRYGLDPVITWIPLYLTLDAPYHEMLKGSWDTLDFAIKLMFLSAIYSGIAVPLVFLAAGLPHASVFLLLSYLAFHFSRQWAIQLAQVYSEVIRTAFDTHRFDLYTTLHFPLPIMSGEQEKKNGEELTQFLWRGPKPELPIIYSQNDKSSSELEKHGQNTK